MTRQIFTDCLNAVDKTFFIFSKVFKMGLDTSQASWVEIKQKTYAQICWPLILIRREGDVSIFV